MSIVNKGFRGRRAQSGPDLPPGQHVTADFPGLCGSISAEPSPGVSRFRAADGIRQRTRRSRPTVDIVDGTPQHQSQQPIALTINDERKYPA